MLVVLALGLPGVARYGLTWDEPTYSRFARLQRDWIGDACSFAFTDVAGAEVFSRERIAEVWLQDSAENGHPPLNETWQAVVGLPFSWMGMHDTVAFRSAIVVLFALTVGVLFLLLRGELSRWASVWGAVSLIGVPVVWAHAHLGATEAMQIFFWVVLAAVYPRVLRGPRGTRSTHPGAVGRWRAASGVAGKPTWKPTWKPTGMFAWMFAWFLLCALAFAAKFTNYLAPLWVLATAGVLGAYRRPRFWVSVVVGAVLAPLALVVIDPYFWPWQGGWARFLDYLGQVGSRAEWIPINVFYMGQGWGFDPPWHYRIVETAAALPVVLLALGIGGLVRAVRETGQALRAQSFGRAGGAGESDDTATGAAEAVKRWTAPLLVTLLGLTWVVGELPGTPNHDATRQFVFVFVGVPLAVGHAAEWVRRALVLPRRRAALVAGVPGVPGVLRTAAGIVVAALVLTSVAVSLRAEPWGLSYRSEWLGGTAGAWARGFEVSYWGESIDGALLEAVAALRADGEPPYVLSSPKLNYFFEAKDLWKPLVASGLRDREVLAEDAVPAFYDRWIPPDAKEAFGPFLRLTFRRPLDGILVFHRRGSIAEGLSEVLDRLVAEGDIALETETVIDGVSMARVYRVLDLQAVQLPFDETGSTWFQPAWVAAQMRQSLGSGGP